MLTPRKLAAWGRVINPDNTSLRQERRLARRRLPDEIAKRVTLNTRTTQPLRDRLVAASQESGRSLAQEVEHRLAASFVTNALEEIVGGWHNFRLGLRVAMMLDHHDFDHDEPWHASPENTRSALAYLEKQLPRLMLNTMTKPASADPEDEADAMLLAALGEPL